MGGEHTLEKHWEFILDWLEEEAPDIYDTLEDGAVRDDIEAFEDDLGFSLPADVQVFFSLVNGGEESDLLPAREAEDVGFSLLSLDESFSARESELELREEFPEEMFSGDDEVAHVVWHPRWVPVASNGEGDYYCIDLAPAKGGTVGQVIAVLQENYERYVISTSISTLIADLAEGLESGKYDYDEDLGIAQFGSDEEE